MSGGSSGPHLRCLTTELRLRGAVRPDLSISTLAVDDSAADGSTGDGG